ncbi:phosphatase PAP2 family protein [Sphingomonas faeni]|uniref:phosphatase PAP2 family protein n=1 Tax=Sphingomonas faeni TaxID=185950 RepID=UPI0020C0B01F|nr:phosphatase PAP2 family protein [Sphingomonas faeni]MCK8457902.1 phosphatase PAP2 family protein [Sphingomonas faeni]
MALQAYNLRSTAMTAPTLPTDRRDIPSWVLIAAMLLSFIAAEYPHTFLIDWVRAVPAVSALIALSVAIIIGRRTTRPRLAAGATAFLQMTLFTLLGVVLAYALAAKSGVLWDDRLAAADRVIGFNWPKVLALLDKVPAAIFVLGLAYHSLTVQMIVVIVALSSVSKFDVLRTTVCAAILSGFVTILISGLTPAMGNLFDPSHYRHLWPSVAWLERGLITGLRDGSRKVLDLTMLMGIVSFPSFHATLAAIFIWSFRAMPRLTVPGAAWAVLTILATPVFGGHYGVDVIMGLILAPPAIIVAHRITRRRPSPCPSTSALSASGPLDRQGRH